MTEHIDRRISEALASDYVTPCARALLSTLALLPSQGRDSAISIAELQQHWKARGMTPWSDREIKRSAKELLEEHHVPLGSRRDGTPGYFLLTTPEDIECAERALVAEVRSLAVRLRAINPKSEISRSLCGQFGLL